MKFSPTLFSSMYFEMSLRIFCGISAPEISYISYFLIFQIPTKFVTIIKSITMVTKRFFLINATGLNLDTLSNIWLVGCFGISIHLVYLNFKSMESGKSNGARDGVRTRDLHIGNVSF